MIDGARLGFLFGLAFFGTMGTNFLIISFSGAVAKILLGTVIATFLGIATGWIRCRLGFNPVFIAVLWAAAEYALMRLGLMQSLFGRIETSLPIFNALSTIFGLVVVSFLIVVANSILLLAIEKAVSAAFPNGKFTLYKCLKIWDFHLEWQLPANQYYFVPEVRGPPSVSLLLFHTYYF
jgi:apolipoprotein N-acyltransferase